MTTIVGKPLVGKPCVIRTKPNTVYGHLNGYYGLIIYEFNTGTYGILTIPNDMEPTTISNTLSEYVRAFERNEFEVITEA